MIIYRQIEYICDHIEDTGDERMFNWFRDMICAKIPVVLQKSTSIYGHLDILRGLFEDIVVKTSFLQLDPVPSWIEEELDLFPCYIVNCDKKEKEVLIFRYIKTERGDFWHPGAFDHNWTLHGVDGTFTIKIPQNYELLRPGSKTKSASKR